MDINLLKFLSINDIIVKNIKYKNIVCDNSIVYNIINDVNLLDVLTVKINNNNCYCYNEKNCREFSVKIDLDKLYESLFNLNFNINFQLILNFNINLKLKLKLKLNDYYIICKFLLCEKYLLYNLDNLYKISYEKTLNELKHNIIKDNFNFSYMVKDINRVRFLYIKPV